MSENSQPLANTKIVNTKFIDDSLTQTISDYSFDIYQSLSKKIIIIYQNNKLYLKMFRLCWFKMFNRNKIWM